MRVVKSNPIQSIVAGRIYCSQTQGAEMARRSKEELKQECRRRLEVLKILWDEFVPADSPSRSIDPGWDARTETDIDSGSKPPGSVLGGINEAIGDIVEWSRDLTPDDLRRVDDKLRHAGVETLSKMRSGRWTKIARSMRKRKISGEDEYRLVAGELSDVGPGGLSDDQRILLEQLMSDYVRAIEPDNA